MVLGFGEAKAVMGDYPAHRSNGSGAAAAVTLATAPWKRSGGSDKLLRISMSEAKNGVVA